MRTPFCFLKNSFILFIVLLQLSFQRGLTQQMQVSPNGRYLMHQDGTPFFYLGDTAWELFHRLNLSEATRYLEDRAVKGFTVIQAVILAQAGGLTAPNANGDLPLVDGDLTKPNEAYFQHVDAIVKKAADLGLTIGMLPTWGSYWSGTNSTELIFTSTTAYSFGDYLGKRYRNSPIIWILGGDENINNNDEREIVEAMAKGLGTGDEGTHLMTFHPRGPGLSSDYFHRAAWLDFNMFQSSHAAHDHDNGLYAEHDYQLRPAKPTLDGEPRYELIPVGFYLAGVNRQDLFDDYDCRQAAYWSILAGACGHTYGHNSIWQMYDTTRTPIIDAVVPWYEAIHHAGSRQMRYVRDLFMARPYNLLVPNQAIVLSGSKDGAGKIRAAVAEDSSFALIYSPRGEKFTVDQGVIKARKLKAIWYDPRYGISHVIHTGNTFGIQTYTPPTSGRGHDWILIIEDADRDFALPGH